MKEPDKIYVSIGYEAQTKPFHHSIEYIRKDTLLEWVREKKERLGKMFDAMPSTAIGAKLDACKEFIEKIESL